MNNNELLGKALKDARIERHKTQDQIAELLDVSPSTISLWESGKRDINAIDMFRYCDAIGYSSMDLIATYKMYLKMKK